MLQFRNRVRRPHVLFAAHPEGVFAAGIERVGKHRIATERHLVHLDRFLCDLEYTDPFDVRGRSAEVFVDQGTRQPDRLENLCAGVRHVGRDTHFRHDLAQALADRLDEVLDRLVAGLRIGSVRVQG